MGQYAGSIALFIKYVLKVLPELNKKHLFPSCRLAQARTGAPGAEREAWLEAYTPDMPLACGSFFSLHPGAEMESTLSFIISLYKLSDTLETYRAAKGIAEEPEARRLYGCLSRAVDPSRSAGCIFANSRKSQDGQESNAAHALCLSEQCRLSLAVLPSFPLVAPKLKKYMQLYIDFHSYHACPEEARREYLSKWSDPYLRRYRDISLMEFCAASDSLLGIAAIYASAADPGLTAGELALLDEAYFPWLCALESLLRAYSHTRQYENRLNYCSAYKNLKECEQRLVYFCKRAEEACMKLKESSFHISLIRLILGMYLSDPQANFGMLRLISRNILKKGPLGTKMYCGGCKLMHLCRCF